MVIRPQFLRLSLVEAVSRTSVWSGSRKCKLPEADPLDGELRWRLPLGAGR
jgi:hypothetical protein